MRRLGMRKWLWGLATVGSLVGRSLAAEPPSLDALVDLAAVQFVPLDARWVETARADVLAAIQAVRARLQDAPPHVREAWSEYLLLDEQHAMIEQMAPVSQQLEQLARLYRRMTVDRKGLEDPAWLALRSAAQKYRAALELAPLDLEAETHARVAQLRGFLKSYEQQSDRETAEQIGATLAWLDSAAQAPSLVAAVRQRYSQPNLWVQVSEQFANDYAQKEVEQISDQVTTILGTVTRGPAATKGKLSLNFVPNESQAEIHLHLRGEIHADRNVGHNGPATIFSASVTHFSAAKAFLIDPRVGITSRKAKANAATDAQVRHIKVEPKHLKNLLDGPYTKAAWKKSQKLHTAAELEASRIASDRIAEQLEAESDKALLEAQHDFDHYVFVGPARTDETPELSSRSTDDTLQVRLKLAGKHQLAAPLAAPTLNVAAPISAAVHESLFNNLSARYIWQGATHDDETLEKFAKMLAGDVPLPLRVFSNSVYWSVTVDSDQPLTIAFDNNQADLTIHTLSWKLGERTYDCPLDIRVGYGLEATKFGILFTRLGPVDIRAAHGHALTSEERQELWRHVEEKANAVFPPSGRFNNLIMPEGGTFGPIGNLRLKQVRCEQGWLTLEY